MKKSFDQLGTGLKQAAMWRRALRNIGVGLAGMALACAGGITACAEWTPPESSVTPPAVVTLDAFAAPDANGAEPSAALVVGPDGALYGSTWRGGVGSYGYGSLFRVETNGAFSKLHIFNGTDGSGPNAALVVGPDGALYGSTRYGPGSYFQGYGTLFRVETNGSFTKLHDFNGTNDGANPNAALVMGPEGALYGSTQNGGSAGYGTLFRLEASGTFTELHDFTGISDGKIPNGPLVVGPDGALYGSAWGGGIRYGTLFRLETNGTFAKVHNFNGSDGSNPYTLVLGPDGALYGSTLNGGTNNFGALFRLETSGTFTKLHDFNFVGFSFPPTPAALVVGSDGALYGSSYYGGSGIGTLFRLETNGTFSDLHDFNSANDGAYPSAALVVGPDGAMYGPALKGGSGGSGTLFRLETNGAFAKLHDFASDGYWPVEPLVAGAGGALYGSALNGGAFGSNGILFRVETDGNFTKLHDFNGTDGSFPYAALVVGVDGALYGSTSQGGTNYGGTLFRLETNGNFTKLHDFNGTDGSFPYGSAMMVGPDEMLYGSTQRGGTNGNGTLFRLETNGNFTKLHDFNGTDGSYPYPALVAGPDDALYGMTLNGGAFGNYGTLFRFETNGSFTKLHDFNGADGTRPYALVTGPNSVLYGSTGSGGTNGHGTLFRLETDGSFTKLHDFNGADGDTPTVLVVGPAGALYGSAAAGGTNGSGALFRFEANGSFAKLHDFNGSDGAQPTAALMVGPDGALYGSTQLGGTNGYGTLFRFETNGSFTKLYDFNGSDGANQVVALAVGPDGALYGSARIGGPRRGGLLFKVVLNRPPVARCHDMTVSAGANCAADASVDDGSFDPDAGDTITLRQEPPGSYPLGVTPVTLTVTDNHGASNSCTATVTVMDTTPPTIGDVAVTPSILWPANHKMVGVTVSYNATDDCGAVSNALFVTSNELPNGPGPDWVIEDDHHLQLRAERSGTGSGRVYTLTIISTDNAGNSSTRTTTVAVPKNEK
jgi:uncharacterized repeat protein (TIGR03803 family)